MAVRLLTRWLAVFCLLAAGLTGAAAEEFRTPSISAVRVKWRPVVDQLRTEIGTRPAIASRFTFAGQRRVPASDPRATPALVQLNGINANIFAGIGRSPVPVLLPFDTADYLEDQADGAPLPLSRYQADFRPADLFHAGPAGYDAVFSLLSGAGGSRRSEEHTSELQSRLHLVCRLLPEKTKSNPQPHPTSTIGRGSANPNKQSTSK